MLQGIKEFIIGEEAPFDPSVFKDPIAMKVCWYPAKERGIKYRTHDLVKIGTDQLEFRASMVAKFYALLAIIIGVGLITSAVLLTSSSTWKVLSILPGLAFVYLGGYRYYFVSSTVFFDKQTGLFWKDRYIQETSTKLENIHALQLISERVKRQKGSFYSYELNLVLKSGARINVVDHGDKETIRQNAYTISRFLEIPVWDAIM